jgi:hypothetical protein
MAPAILFDNSHITIQLNDEHLALEWCFKPGNRIAQADFQEYLDIYLLLYSAHRDKYVALSGLYYLDYTEAILPEAIMMAGHENTPLLYAAGMRRQAFVVPPQALSREMETAIALYKRLAVDIDVQTFSELEPARLWLQSANPWALRKEMA